MCKKKSDNKLQGIGDRMGAYNTLNLKEELKPGIQKQSGSNIQTQDPNMLAFRYQGCALTPK